MLLAHVGINLCLVSLAYCRDGRTDGNVAPDVENLNDGNEFIILWASLLLCTP